MAFRRKAFNFSVGTVIWQKLILGNVPIERVEWMTNNKVIAITLYRRPDYTRQMFESLRQCFGIEDYRVLISCDYDARYDAGCNDSWHLACQFAASRPEGMTEIFVNNPKLGIDLNKLFILPKAYELSDYVIFIEDDTIPAQDALRFFEFCAQLAKDPDCVAICAYDRYMDEAYHTRALAKQAHAVLKRPKMFSSWGWAMTRDSYERLYGMDGQKYIPNVDAPNGRFDWWISWNYRDNDYCVFPRIPRFQSVGGERGEHTPNAEWHRENEYNPLGAWSQPMPDTDDWILIDDVSMREELWHDSI